MNEVLKSEQGKKVVVYIEKVGQGVKEKQNELLNALPEMSPTLPWVITHPIQAIVVIIIMYWVGKIVTFYIKHKINK